MLYLQCLSHSRVLSAKFSRIDNKWQNVIIFTLIAFLKLIKHYLTAVNCPALNLQNGQISYSTSAQTNGGYFRDTIATFLCNRGYNQTGSQQSTCQTSGNWNQEPPTCTQSKSHVILNQLNSGFPIPALKFVEFIQLVELGKCFTDSVIYCLWILFFCVDS